MSGVVVVGQVGRDLVLTVEGPPEAGGSADVLERKELLGGKGANQAVACRQLGAVVRRPGAPKALLVDLVGPRGIRRLREDVDARMLLNAGDVRASRSLLRSADAVLVQPQQPGPAVTEARDAASAGGALTVAGGTVEGRKKAGGPRSRGPPASIRRADRI